MAASLADRARGRLEDREWARVNVLLLVGLSAAAAFLASIGMLALHVHSMAWRYAVAALAGYGVFLALLHAWVQRKQERFVPDSGVDLSDLPGPGDIPLPGRAAGDVTSSAFRGGRSGGAGASSGWGTPTSSTTTTSGGGKGGGFSFDLDGDDLFWLLVALAAAFAGIAAIAYVVWTAPALLGEAAVNAAVAGRVYRGIRKREPDHWARDLLRKTGVPAAIVVASMALAGYALQRVAPEARSIGGVWQHIRR